MIKIYLINTNKRGIETPLPIPPRKRVKEEHKPEPKKKEGGI